MNIANALNVALPELPERAIQRSVPKLDPRVIAKEHIEKRRPTILAKLPGAETFVRLEVQQWAVLQLFDGERSYGEISEQATARTGVRYTEDVVREFASFVQGNTDLFYKSPLEKNITLQQKLRGQRLKRKRVRLGDFTDIPVADWPNADAYVTKIYPYMRWAYTWWFTLMALAMFAVMAWMWAGRFGEIWRDSFEFYNFTTMSGRDLFEFWILFGATGFLHESFHGLTCKHFGGNVEKMGATLMYFAPSFFCDITQVWIFGGKWERIATVIAGIWGDMIVCFFGTVAWWATTPGMFVHTVAYKVMMVTGIGVSLLNLNPLIKLDGYFIFCELIGEPDFKERTSAYLSGWTRKHLFGMPAEVEFVPRRKRPFYLIYAVLSAIYGYLLLSFLMMFTYNALHRYSPAWAFVPAALMGFWVFKGRLQKGAQFLKLFYLDKREHLWKVVTSWRFLSLATAALFLLFLPFWPDFQDGSFVLEPARQASVHAAVEGRVLQVLVDEGQRVAAGQALVTLENLDLESDLARVQADLRVATARATQSQMHYGDFGTAERERLRLAEQDRGLTEKAAKLQLASPIDGVVATSRLHDLIGSHLDEGALVLDLIDDSALRARVYVPEYAMHDVRVGTPVRLQVPSRLLPVTGTIRLISADWSALDPALGEKEQLEGISPPRFYVADAWVDRAVDLRPGMTGVAKIRVGRRSLASLTARFVRDLVARRIW